MIEVLDVVAARLALARRALRCPDCRGPLRPWGRARARTVRDVDGAGAAVCPDRARCTLCQATHVVLGAAMLPRRAYTVGVVGQALLGAARGRGHRPIAAELGVPPDTVRGWIRRARHGAEELRIIGVRAVVALDPDTLPTRVLGNNLAHALEALTAAALATQRRLGTHHIGLWPHIAALTRGQLLATGPAG